MRLGWMHTLTTGDSSTMDSCTSLVESHSKVKGRVSCLVGYQHPTVLLQEFVDGERLAGDAVLASIVEWGIPLVIHTVSLGVVCGSVCGGGRECV